MSILEILHVEPRPLEVRSLDVNSGSRPPLINSSPHVVLIGDGERFNVERRRLCFGSGKAHFSSTPEIVKLKS